MTRMHGMVRGLALAAVALCAPAAHADVTPRQVLDMWKGMTAGPGQTFEVGKETDAGQDITLKDVTVTTTEKDGSQTIATLPEVSFKDLGNGTVAVTMAPEYTLRLLLQSNPGAPRDLTLKVAQQGVKAVVSGTPKDMTIDLKGEEMSVTLTRFEVGGKPRDMQGQLVMTGLRDSYTVKTDGKTRHFTGSGGAKGVSLTFSASKNDGQDKIALTAGAKDLTSQFELVAADGVGKGDMNAALRAGSDFKVAMKSGAVQFSTDLDENGVRSHAGGGADSIALGLGVGKTGVTSKLATKGAQVTVSGGKLPVPKLAFSLSEALLDTTIPLLPSEQPQPVTLHIKLAGLGVDKALWSMFDPGKVLPRDPVTLEIDLGGEAKILRDLAPPKGAPMPKGQPVQMTALTLKSLQLKGLGADVTGTGQFALDYPSQDPNAKPKVSGGADFAMHGLMGLIDKLVKLGAIPEDKLMGTKMMLGLFTAPGKVEGERSSKIEMTEDGKVFVNGQRMK